MGRILLAVLIAGSVGLVAGFVFGRITAPDGAEAGDVMIRRAPGGWVQVWRNGSLSGEWRREDGPPYRLLDEVLAGEWRQSHFETVGRLQPRHGLSPPAYVLPFPGSRKPEVEPPVRSDSALGMRKPPACDRGRVIVGGGSDWCRVWGW